MVTSSNSPIKGELAAQSKYRLREVCVQRVNVSRGYVANVHARAVGRIITPGTELGEVQIQVLLAEQDFRVVAPQSDLLASTTTAVANAAAVRSPTDVADPIRVRDPVGPFLAVEIEDEKSRGNRR